MSRMRTQVTMGNPLVLTHDKYQLIQSSARPASLPSMERTDFLVSATHTHALASLFSRPQPP